MNVQSTNKRDVLALLSAGAITVAEAAERLRAYRLRDANVPGMEPAGADASEAGQAGITRVRFYGPAWKPLPEVSAAPAGAASPALLIGPAEAMRAPLPPGCVTASYGDGFRQTGPRSYVFQPEAAEDVDRLLRALRESGQPAARIAIRLPSAATDPLGPLTCLFRLAKALQAARLDGGCDLLVIGEPTPATGLPSHFGAAGFAAAAAAETPALRIRVVTQPHGSRPEDWDAIVAEFADPAAGTEVRRDAGTRFARTHAPLPIRTPAAEAFRQGGVYLITGGAGRLGLAVAEHLSRRYGARVALLGRSAPRGDAARRIAALPAAHVLRADIGSAAETADALAELRDRFGGIDGILHAAGTLEDAFLLHKSVDSFRRVLAPKIAGALHLHAASRDDRLELFALFSSLTAVTGNAGQCDYAAANGFLDEFAEWRSAERLAGRCHGRTLSLNWPLWRDGGMTPSDSYRALIGLEDDATLTTEEGVEALEQALAQAGARVVVTLQALDALVVSAAASSPAAPADTAVATMTAADGELRQRAEAYLTELVADAVNLPVTTIRPGESFAAYGLDSMIALRLTARLEASFGPLSKTLFFEYDTIETLAEHFDRQHGAALVALVGVPPPPAPPAPPAPPPGREPRASPPSPPQPAPRRAARAVPAARGDIAVVGLAGRYPMARSVDELWDNLVAGRDCITEIPAERWDLEGFYDPDTARKDRSYSKWGGFLDGVDRFSPLFFQISPREAAAMDPQERLFLEVAWNAIEDAGYTPQTVVQGRRQVGVFVGVMSSDYQLFAAEEAVRGRSVAAGSWYYSIANRVSYCLDFHGPSMAIDTACSSSLTALHLACLHLRRGDCRAAIAGGVNLSIHPSKYLQITHGHFASTDGRCRAFGKGGDGYVPGEGVGAVLLKPLEDALAERAHIYGVIRGSAVNHGGRTSGYNVPSLLRQAELVEAALDEAGVEARSIGYVEAHGAGTALGDPIELAALTKAYAARTADRQFCGLGSLKSNIGHLEAAAGIAGLTKLLLQLRHRTLVPTLHAEEPNPNLELAQSPFRLQTTGAAWQRPDPATPRRAAISSFGAGGANAHAILEEVEPRPAVPPPAPRPELILLSARERERLPAMAANLAAALERMPAGSELADIAFTLRVGRVEMEHRLALLASSVEALVPLLRQAAAGLATEGAALDPGIFVGVAGAEEDLLGDGPEAHDFLRRLIDKGELARIARHWVRGVAMPWAALDDGQRQRVRLPGYAFAGRRYWVPRGSDAAAEPPAAPAATGPAHPLLDAIRPDFAGLVVTRKLEATHWILDQHRVNGVPLLPAVAMLEMVRAACEVFGGTPLAAIGDVAWSRPVAVEAAPVALEVALRRVEGSLRWTISSESGEHARGTLQDGAAGPPPPPRDPAALAALLPDRIEGAAFYDRLARHGFAHGARMRGIAEIRHDARRALARLSVGDAAPGMRLDPRWMDAALQATAAILGAEGREPPQLVPAGLGRLLLHGTQLPAWIHAERRPPAGPDGAEHFDIEVLDATGEVIVRFEDFRARAMRARPAAAEPAGTAADPAGLFYVPRWQRLERPTAPDGLRQRPALLIAPPALAELSVALAALHGGRLCEVALDAALPLRSEAELEAMLAGLPAFDAIYFVPPPLETWQPSAGLVETTSRSGVLLLLKLVRAMGRLGLLAPPRSLCLLTTGAAGLDDEAEVMPAQGALLAFAKALAQDHPKLPVRLVDLDRAEIGAAGFTARLGAALAAAAGDPAPTLLLRGPELFLQRLLPVELPAPRPEMLPLRRQGVYVLFGGAGGIGQEIAAYLARQVEARLVLVGRSPEGPSQRALLDRLQRLGGQAAYMTCDITDEAALRELRRRILQRFGAIHGLVHGAIVLHDRGIANMDEAAFATAFAPKAQGTAAIDAVFGGDAPDFVLFLSTASALIGSRGQSNYVAGSGFKDAYAHHLRRRGVRAQTINWGFWGETGIVASAAYRERIERQGVLGLGTREGVAAFERILGAGLGQVMAIRLQPQIEAALGIDRRQTLRLAEARAEPGLPVAADQALRPWLQQHRLAAAPLVEAVRALVHTRLDRVLAALQALGFPVTGATGFAAVTAAADFAVAPRQARLLAALLGVLQRHGLLEPEGEDRLVFTELARARLRAPAADASGAAGAAVPAHAALLDQGVGELAAILSGRVAAPAVLFPNGSTALVEAVYRQDPVNKVYNEAMAEAVRGIAAAARGPLRILEIGAGTGSASSGLIAALAPFAGRVEIEYVYSDVSPKFVQHGRALLAARFPFVRFAVLDLAQPAPEQGFAPGSFDLVAASHVLHALPRLEAALNEIKKLLKADGLLLLNEAASVEDFATLTFGLLDGWWQFEDAQRLDGSPLLGTAGWRAALQQAGFGGVRCHSLIADAARLEVEQLLILARSDGLARFAAAPPAAAAPVPRGEAPASPTPAAPAKAPPRAATPADPVPPSPARPPPGAEVAAGAARPLDRYIEEQITAAVMQAFGLAPDEVDAGKAFAEFGADSIVSLELIDQVNAALGLSLKTPVLFDHSTIRDLSRFVLAQHGAEIARQLAAEAGRPSAQLAQPAMAEPLHAGPPSAAPEPQPEPDGLDGLKALLEALEQGRLTPEEAARRVPIEL